MWTDTTWDAFCGLLEEGWPGKFDDSTAKSWRLLLADVDPAAAVTALKRLMHRGARFRPSASELLGETNHDAGRPTFDEAFRLIFEPRGVLWASRTADQSADDAAWERAQAMHPTIPAFVRSQGLPRLRALPVNDPDYGAIRRAELEAAWTAFVESADDRKIAALAAGGGNTAGLLKRLDPLAVLDVPPALRQLGAGT